MLAIVLGAALVTQPTSYRIDPQRAEAGFELQATMHTVHGTTHAVRGEIRAEPADGGAIALSGSIEVDAASLATGNSRRDATMHGTSLDVATYPAIVFTPARFDPDGAPSSDGTTEGVVTGQLTIRGKTLPAKMRTKLTPRAGRIAAEGRFDVAWADFGVPDPSFFVVRVSKIAVAHFAAELVAVP